MSDVAGTDQPATGIIPGVTRAVEDDMSTVRILLAAIAGGAGVCLCVAAGQADDRIERALAELAASKKDDLTTH